MGGPPWPPWRSPLPGGRFRFRLEKYKPLKIGFVMFLSGAAAGPFGVPARNAAELTIEAINAGTVPAPYDSTGIAGRTVEAVFVDENSKQSVAVYRKLVEKDEVDLVIGYISSGNCKAIAPVAEEIKKLTVFFDCGTPQVFEEVVTEPGVLCFRAGAHATMDNVAAARYLLAVKPNTKSISGINQELRLGTELVAGFRRLHEGADAGRRDQGGAVPEDLRRPIRIRDLGAADRPAGRGPFQLLGRGHGSARAAERHARAVRQDPGGADRQRSSAMHRLGAQMPNGTILGGRGPHGDLAPDNALNDWFRQQYFDRYGTWPTYPSYKMALAILGVKTAYDKAAAGGAAPSPEDVIKAFENLEWESPSGTVKMAISNGHQAIQETAYGVFKFDKETGKATLVDVKRYKAECVNPPAGVNSLDWIQSGFKGAQV